MDVNPIIEIIKKTYNPEYILIFGSFASGSTHPNSDLDIAFYQEAKTLDPYNLFLVANEISDYVKRPVDLINFFDASTVFRRQIFINHKKIYSKNDYLYHQHELMTNRMYEDLNVQRHDLIEEIKESGTIYGTG